MRCRICSDNVSQHSISPTSFFSLTMASSKTTAETFVQQLEIERLGFDDDAHPLPKYQYDAFCLCRDLLLESEVVHIQTQLFR
jgi:hypothetical protein